MTAQEAVRIVVVSDLNGSYGSTTYGSDVHRAIRATIALEPDLVLSTGDMVAGQRRPHLSEAEIRAMWRGFHNAVTDPLAAAGIPLAVTPGNHDGSAYPGFELERRIYREEWLARRPDLAFVGPDTYPFFYGFDIGPARVVSLDATRVGHLDPAQMDHLSSVFRGAGPTRIVFSHIPLWPFAINRETEIIGDPELESLLERVEIDLHLSGHHHAFYPGFLDAFSVVSQAELGGGARRLIGTRTRAPSAITVLDIMPDGAIRISAFRAPDFTTPVDIDALPPKLVTRDRVIRRLDRVPSGDVGLARP
ncbi:metallophosphoesterase family protein [Roseovarius aestuariivivens]|uniref:metallophosphoesterase family protein n=1 Tax=Roseovarius aestuariivivens TaxID=1888910 RepID=UPI0014369734|nr:metallophosphoesterase [Roseovarius aestuariivivens]